MNDLHMITKQSKYCQPWQYEGTAEGLWEIEREQGKARIGALIHTT